MVNVIQSPSCVPLLATPWTPGQQHARRVLHYFLEFPQAHVHRVCDAIQPSHPLLLLLLPSDFRSNRVFSEMSQLFSLGGQSIEDSASASVLSVNVQGWFPLGLTGLIAFLSQGLSRVFSSTTVESISSLVLSLIYDPTLTSVPDYCKNHSFDYMDLCWQNDVPVF